MRAVVQRVTKSRVTVNGREVAMIERGFLILLGITHADSDEQALYLAKKISGLRLFEDDAGKMNLSLADVAGEALVVSQFTLYGDVRKGRRPSFTDAAAPAHAQPLYQRFCTLLAAEGVTVKQGVFQAHMKVALVNDGPVTMWLDTATMMK